MLTEKRHAEHRDEDDAQLIDRCDAGGIADLQGAEVANPGGTRRKARKGKEQPASRTDRIEWLKFARDRKKDGQHGNYHQRPKERGQIGVDPFDADLRENRGHRGEAGGAQCPDEPGR